MRLLVTIVVVALASPARAEEPNAAPGADAPPGANDVRPDALHDDTPYDDDTLAAPVVPTRYTAIDVATAPKVCSAAAFRVTKATAAVSPDARLAYATCLADASASKLSLIDGHESVLALEAAIAPSLGLFDEVIALATPSYQLLAHHAKLRVYLAMAGRMLASVPQPAQSTSAAAELAASRRQIVELMIEPWREQIRVDAQAVIDLAKKHPELAKNRVAANAILESRKLAPVATASASVP